MINLHKEFKKELVEGFYHDSYTANKASDKYSFRGNKEIVLSAMIAVDPAYGPASGTNGLLPGTTASDLTQSIGWLAGPRAGGDRFGTVTDVEDETQTLKLKQHLRWTKSIDGSDNSQQAYMKSAGDYMALMMHEKINPIRDTYTLMQWARNAGSTYGVGSSSIISSSDIVGVLCDIEVKYGEEGVPEDDRYVFTRIDNWKSIRLAPQWQGADTLAREKVLKGVAGKFNTLNIVFVPSTYMPKATTFVAIQKDCVLAPMTWKTARILETAQGYDGPVMEYHDMWDAFVIGKKNKGVIVGCYQANKAVTPTVTRSAVSSGKVTLSILAKGTAADPTSNVGNVVYYTLDGTDPRYSDTRITLPSATTATSVANVPSTAYVRIVAATFPDNSTGAVRYFSEEVAGVAGDFTQSA